MAESLLAEKIGRREALGRIGAFVAGMAAMPLVGRCAPAALRARARAAAWASGRELDQRPNLVLIIADDLGYGDVGCFGCPDIATPNLDAMASQGVRFSSFYVAAPVCSPTRVSTLTGKYSQRTSLSNLPDSHDPNAGLSSDEVTVAELLRSAGYATGLVGKWHLGYSPKFRPRRQGFDEFVGELAGSAGYFDHIYGTDGINQKWLFRNDTPWDEAGYLTDIWTREAKSFISRHTDDPFFLYLPYNAPHGPLVAPDGSAGDTRQIYKAIVERLDYGIGQVMQHLRDLGLEENTLVVFFSDNGADLSGSGDNGPLRGGKWTIYEGAIRTPFIAKWPARITPGRVVSEPIISMDVYNTFAAAAGVKVPSGCGVDGRNVLKVLQGAALSPHEYLFWSYSGAGSAVRRGKWKLVMPPGGGATELYDLSTDIGEANNVAAQQSSIVRELTAKLAQWQDSLGRRGSYLVTDD